MSTSQSHYYKIAFGNYVKALSRNSHSIRYACHREPHHGLVSYYFQNLTKEFALRLIEPIFVRQGVLDTVCFNASSRILDSLLANRFSKESGCLNYSKGDMPAVIVIRPTETVGRLYMVVFFGDNPDAVTTARELFQNDLGFNRLTELMQERTGVKYG